MMANKKTAKKRTNEIPDLIQDVLYAEKHRLLDESKGRKILKVFRAGVADSFIIEFIRGKVHRHKIAQAFTGPFPLPKLNKGNFIQGMDQRKRPVVYPLQYNNAHSFTLGGPGSGKTHKAQFHSLQILPQVAGGWLFDCRKREFEKLRKPLERVGVDLIILPAREMKINPLEVPLGVDPYEWIARASDMLVMVLQVPPRGSKILQTVLHKLYKKLGVFEGKEFYPTLFDLFAEVKRDTQLNPQARSAIIDSLEALLSSLGHEVLAYRRAWPVHELAKMHINFILGGINQVAQNLLLNTLLLAEFTSRISRGVSNVDMDLWMSIDESQRVFAKSGIYTSAFEDLFPLLRGTGLGLDLSVPSSHNLMPEVLSFTATKYLGRCGSASDYELLGRSIGMSKEQLEWVFHNLRPGVMIAQVGEGQHRYPYVLQIPNLKLPPPTQEEPFDSNKFRSLPFISA